MGFGVARFDKQGDARASRSGTSNKEIPTFFYVQPPISKNYPAWESGILYIVTMDRTIIGRIGEKVISETIQNYQSNIPEQELTAKKNIRNKFADQGYNPNDVIF